MHYCFREIPQIYHTFAWNLIPPKWVPFWVTPLQSKRNILWIPWLWIKSNQDLSISIRLQPRDSMSETSRWCCCSSQPQPPFHSHHCCNTTALWLWSYKLQPMSWYTWHPAANQGWWSAAVSKEVGWFLLVKHDNIQHALRKIGPKVKLQLRVNMWTFMDPSKIVAGTDSQRTVCSVSGARAFFWYSGFFGVRSGTVLLEISWNGKKLFKHMCHGQKSLHWGWSSNLYRESL